MTSTSWWPTLPTGSPGGARAGRRLVQFNFKISGDMSLAVSRTEPLRWNRPSLLVWAQPTGVDISEWTAPSARERFIIISIRPEFLAEHFLTSSVDVPEQLRAFAATMPEKINFCQRPLSAQTFDVATRLINSKFTGPLGLVYTEALALELLCCAVGSFASISGAPSEEYTDRELRCLHAARSALMRQFGACAYDHQACALRRDGQINFDSGLQGGFRRDHIRVQLRCRMRHALTLMRDQSWSVAKVSEAVGYSHPTSFTTAFRRHFGMRPIDVRRVKLRE